MGRAVQLGDYELGKQIGGGGFGDVFEATRRDDGTRWAVKVLREPDREAIRELKHEARTLWNLPLPGLVTPAEIGCHEDQWFMAVELADGRTLRDEAASHGQGDVGWVAGILAELAHILARVHEHGVLHLDLKPENVIVHPGSGLTLLDFGLSQWHGRAPAGTRSVDAVTAFSAGYVAPELLFGGQPDAASDLYSLGAIGLELLTGRPPSPTRHQQDLRPLQAHGRVGEVCAGLLLRDASLRWTARQVLEALGVEPAVETASDEEIFVGRTRELEALDQHWRHVVETARSRLLLLVGAPGIGKTALLLRWLEGLAARGARSFRGRCYELERGSYKGFDDFVRVLAEGDDPRVAELRERIAVMFPDLGEPSGTERSPRELRDAFAELVDCGTGGSPYALWMDDAQWADPDGRILLMELLGPRRTPALVVCTVRSEHVAAFEAELEHIRRGGTKFELSRLELGPLEDDDALELIRLRHAGLDEAVGRTLLAQGGGNPFVLERLTHVISSDDRPELASALEHQLEQLSAGQRAAVELVSIAGRALPEAVLIDALRVVEAKTSVAALTVRGWLRTTVGPARAVAIYHDLIRPHVLEGLSPARGRVCHATLLEVLEQHRAPPSDMFEHALAVDDHPKAARLALAAGREADERVAFENAARWYRHAVEHAERVWEPSERIHVETLLASALDSAGKPRDAATWYMRARAETESADERWQLGLASAEAWMTSGDFEHGRDMLEGLLREHELPVSRGPLRVVASILGHLVRLWRPRLDVVGSSGASTASRRAELCWVMAKGLAYTKPLEALDFALRSLAAALRGGTPEQQSRTLAFLGGGVFFQVRPLLALAERYMAAADELARRSDSEVVHASVSLWRGAMEISTGRWSQARTDLESTLRRLERAPKSRWDRATAKQFVAWLDWREGDLGAMAKIARAEQLDAAERGDQLAWVVFSHYVAFACIAEDQPSAATELAAQVHEVWSTRGYNVQSFYTTEVEVEAALYQGDPATARAAWQRTQADFRRAGGHRAPTSRIDNCLLEARVLAHEGGGARLEALAIQLGREARADAVAHASWLESAIRGDERGLMDAAAKLVAAGCGLAGLALRYQLAVLAGDDDRASAVAHDMHALGVVDPSRWSPAYYPLMPQAK